MGGGKDNEKKKTPEWEERAHINNYRGKKKTLNEKAN